MIGNVVWHWRFNLLDTANKTRALLTEQPSPCKTDNKILIMNNTCLMGVIQGHGEDGQN